MAALKDYPGLLGILLVAHLLLSKREPVFPRHVCNTDPRGTTAFGTSLIRGFLMIVGECTWFWCQILSWSSSARYLFLFCIPRSWTWGRGCVHWMCDSQNLPQHARLLCLVTAVRLALKAVSPPHLPPSALLTHSMWSFLCVVRIIVHQNVFIWDTKMQNCWDIKHFPISYNTATMYKRSDDKCAHI